MTHDLNRRLTIKVTDDLFERIKGVRHGFRGHLVASLLTVALDAIDKDGEIMVGAIISGEYKLVPDLKRHDVS